VRGQDTAVSTGGIESSTFAGNQRGDWFSGFDRAEGRFAALRLGAIANAASPRFEDEATSEEGGGVCGSRLYSKNLRAYLA